MANFSSVDAFGQALLRMERDVEAKRRDIGTKVAEAARPEGYRAAAAKLGGDPKFSGWRPWLELQVKSKDYGAAIIPTRSSAGPWTVGEVGRNKGDAAGFSGPGINRRTGLTSRTKSGGIRKVREFRSRTRWNGYTAGKGVASDATERFNKVAGPIAEKEFGLVIRKHFSVN